jgi:hypothetical protein
MMQLLIKITPTYKNELIKGANRIGETPVKK